MLAQFRQRYPKGSIISELINIDHGKYIVKVSIEVEQTTLATGLAAAETIELAEDRAQHRALTLLNLEEDSTAAKTIPTTTPLSSIPTKATTVVATVPSNHTEDEQSSHNGEADLPAEQFDAVVATAPTKTDNGNQSPPNSSISESVASNQNLNQVNAVEVETPNDTVETTKSEPVASTQSEDFTLTPPPSAPAETIESEPQSLPLEPQIEPAAQISPTDLEPVAEAATETIEPAEDATETTDTTTAQLDFHDVIAKTDVELQRLGWTTEQGRDYLIQTYGKRSRVYLKDEELLEFLHYLESLPTSA